MSDCGVCIGDEWDESNEFQCVTTPKARKPHCCEDCGRQIPKGSHYMRFAGKFDGSMFDFKVCLVCREISAAFSVERGGVNIGDLWQEMELQFPRMGTGCFDRLETPEAKSYLRERWMQWKGLAA